MCLFGIWRVTFKMAAGSDEKETDSCSFIYIFNLSDILHDANSLCKRPMYADLWARNFYLFYYFAVIFCEQIDDVMQLKSFSKSRKSLISIQ